MVTFSGRAGAMSKGLDKRSKMDLKTVARFIQESRSSAKVEIMTQVQSQSTDQDQVL